MVTSQFIIQLIYFFRGTEKNTKMLQFEDKWPIMGFQSKNTQTFTDQKSHMWKRKRKIANNHKGTGETQYLWRE